MKIDEAKHILELKNSSLEQRIEALDALNVQLDELILLAVSSLRFRQGRYFVAERIFKLGSTVINPLEELFEQTDDRDLKTVIALLLIKLGSTNRKHWLIDALISTKEDVCLIANALANAGIKEAANTLIKKFHVTKITEIDTLLCLCNALETLGEDMPTEVSDASYQEIIGILKTVDLSDFDTIAKSLELIIKLKYQIDSNIVSRLATSPSNHRLLKHYNLDFEA